MKTPIFKIVNHIDKNTTEDYLFVGKVNKNLIKKLKDNTITKDEISTLKNQFTNYSLLKNNIDAKIIYENIYDDDNIITLKNKISNYVEKLNPEHIYLWNNYKINDFELIDILSNIFKSVDKISSDKIITIVKNLFGIKIGKKKILTINIEQLYNILKKENLTAKIPTELTFFDINNNQNFIKSDPYKNIKINRMFLTDGDSYNINNNLPIKSDSFNIIKNKVNNYTINFTSSNNLFDAYKKKLNVDDELIINGAIRIYFPSVVDMERLEDYNEFSETVHDTIKDADNLIRKFMDTHNSIDEQIKNNKSLVSRIHVKIEPTLLNTPKNMIINLEGYFNNFETTDDIPLLIHKKTNNNIFKINKKSLSKRIEIDDKKINGDELIKSVEKLNTIRKSELLEFKIFFKNFNEINVTNYFKLVIFSNGKYDIVYEFKKDENAIINDIFGSFDLVNDIISSFNKKFNINLLLINPDIFNVNVDFINFEDFTMKNELSFNKVILNDELIKKGIEIYYPYFEIVKDNKLNNLISIKYNREDYFIDDGNIETFISDNMYKDNKSVLIDKISKKFNISKTLAQKKYDNVKDSILFDNRQTKAKNKSIFILLKITNKLEIQFLVKNLKNLEYNNIINKLLSFISIDNTITKKGKDVNKSIKSYKDYNKDAKDNILQRRDILSDDEFDFLSNSNNDKSNNDKSNNDDANDNNDVNTNSMINENNILDIELNDDDMDLLDAFNNEDEYDKDKAEDEDIIIKDDELEVEIDIDFNKLNDPKEKRKYDKLVLKRLKAADTQLFKKPYTKKCQAVHKKQPIVITTSEKDYIDTNYPGSYTTFVKAGSTPSKINKYFYICPKYWCPLSAVSLTDKQYKDLGNKCPKGEPAIISSNQSWVKKDKDGNKVDVPRYPFLLDPSLHPDKLKAPCCRGKPPDKLENKEKNEKYIIQSKAAAKPDRYATIPNKLSKILNNKYPSDYMITSGTDSYVRKGLNDNNQSALSSLIDIIDNKKITSIDDFIKILENNMTKIDYFELNNGNTLKIYINTDYSIYDEKVFENFKKNFSNDKDYIKKMNLQEMAKELSKMKIFENNDDNQYNNDILREFMIYNSFENFKLYLRSDLFKTHNEILQLFSNHYNWLNVNKYNIIVINISNKNKQVEKIQLLCSKFINYKEKLDNKNDVVFIIKNDNIYEPMVKIKNSNRTKANEINVIKSFSYNEDPYLKSVIDYQKKCVSNDTNKINPIKLHEILTSNLLYDIKCFVINMSFKFCGFLLTNNLFIPIDSDNISTNIFREQNIIIKEYIYIHNIIKYKCKLTSNQVLKILNAINKELGKDYYKIKTTIKDDNIEKGGNDEIAIILEDFKHSVIPLKILSKNKEVYLKNIIDETIFLGTENDNDATSYTNNYLNVMNAYNYKLKIISNHIISDIKLLNNIQMLKHKYNPFPKDIIINKISNIIDGIINKHNIDDITDEEKDKLINDIYTKDIIYIIKKSDSDLKVNKHEIVFEHNDILQGKLKKLNLKLKNPYKNIENSIEDYVTTITLGITEYKSKDKDISVDTILTDTFKLIPVYTWKDLLPRFELNIKDDKDNKNITNYLLELFSTVSKIQNSKTKSKAKSLTKKKLEKDIDSIREKEHKKDVTEFIEQHRQNLYFQKIYDKLEDFDIQNYENFNEIFDENYKYSLYEIEKLSKLVGISVIILSAFETKRFRKGHMVIDNGDKCIILFMTEETNYDRFDIVVEDTNKFIFNMDINKKDKNFKNILPVKFIEYIENASDSNTSSN